MEFTEFLNQLLREMGLTPVQILIGMKVFDWVHAAIVQMLPGPLENGNRFYLAFYRLMHLSVGNGNVVRKPIKLDAQKTIVERISDEANAPLGKSSDKP